jgi:type II secretory pathway pseudopilin PulG
MTRRLHFASRPAFTIVELLVSMGVILLLLGIGVPAVMVARESARRTICQNNLRQILLACHSYHDAHSVIPPVGNDRFEGSLDGAVSFHDRLRPYLGCVGQNPIPDELAWNQISTFLCPSDAIANRQPAGVNYHINTGTVAMNGFNELRLKGFWRPSKFAMQFGDLSIGLSHVVLLSERTCYSNPYHSSGTDNDFLAQMYLYENPYQSGDDVTRDWELIDACEAGHVSPIDQPGSGPRWDHQSGYSHIRRPNTRHCPFRIYDRDHSRHQWYVPAASRHAGGVYAGYADGHVVFISESIDRLVWATMGTYDGEVPSGISARWQ